MIGMIVLAITAVLLFFGVSNRFFAKTGVANWVAFLIVLAFAVASLFPPLTTERGVSFSFAGFVMPLLLGVVCLFALGANANLLRAIVGALSVAGIVIAARVALPPIDGYRAAMPSIFLAGIAGGIVAFAVGQNRLSMLAAALVGAVLGDFITAMLFRFVLLSSGYLFALGQFGAFDIAVLATLTGGVTLEISHAIVRAVRRRRGKLSPAPEVQFEAGEDTLLISPEKKEDDEDDDLYDDYFNDDID